jgi:hypothetical protein
MPIPYNNEEVIQTAGTAWAVTATHNFLSQSITESTPLTTAGLATPGVENYIEEYLNFDYNILLPKAGSTSHFVSPNQPIFTFTKPTRVVMIIPTTTVLANIHVAAIDQPLITAGWVYSTPKNSIAANVDAFTHRITNSPPDYLYERVFPAGSHNLDPTALAPLAFYLFEEKSFDDTVFTNTTNIATSIFNITRNTGLLSATPGIATGGKALILHSSGDVGIGTTGAPDTKLHVVGDIKATGTITGKKQFYQTVNSYNNQVNNLPVSLTSNLTSKLNNNGLASLASNWTRFPSWKQDASDDTINTDLNNGNDQLGVFQDVLGGYGVKVKAAGYYKATCQMHFYSTTANTSVAIRFAKNALVDDVQDQDTENPGPCQMSNVSANTASSACLSHVMLCAVDDVISVYTSKAGADGTVVTSPASCTLLIEFFGLDV